MENFQITRRLMELIREMPPEQQEDLLKVLEWGRRDQRRHSRRPSARPAVLTASSKRYQGVVRNISQGGVFIETPARISIGQEVFLSISLFSFEDPMTITGRVIRIEPMGVAVQFDAVFRDLFKSGRKPFRQIRKKPQP